MNTVQLDVEAMKEVVEEYYPVFFSTKAQWSKWTLLNVYNYIAAEDDDQLLSAYLLDVASYMSEVLADGLKNARADYASTMETNKANWQASKEVKAFYAEYIAPLTSHVASLVSDEKYLRKHRYSIMNFIKEYKDTPIDMQNDASAEVRQVISRARELYHKVARPDVDTLIQLMPADVKERLVRMYCADRNIDDALQYINCEVPDFVSIEPNLDKLIKDARARVEATRQADPHDLMGKFVVPIMVGKYGLKPDEMTSVNNQHERFIRAIMRFDSSIMSMFQDQPAKVRDAVVAVLNSYRDAQYRALEELSRVVLLSVNDGFSKTILQYYVPAVHDYVQGRVDHCEVTEPELHEWLRQARDELAAVAKIKADESNVVGLDWPSTLTTRQRELIGLMVFTNDVERDKVIKQLSSLNVDDLLRYVRGEVKIESTTLNTMLGEELCLALKRTRLNYLSGQRQSINTGANEMSMNINYHGRLEVTEDAMKGTITLSIDGELAIVDVSAPHGQPRVDYTWVTIPKSGYDTTVHGHVVWLGTDAAVAVTVVVFKDGGIASTVTVTKDVCGVRV